MFPVIPVEDDAPIMYEQLGTKKKFWMDNFRLLYKETREGTGEDWAEKVTCELCDLLEIPHAHYDLAVWKGKRGVVTENFALGDEGKRLILGNELLFKLDPMYPKSDIRRVRQHTVRKVVAITDSDDIGPPIQLRITPEIKTAGGVFVGYLMFDVWVANQDRHHENWGLILDVGQKSINLAPSFDHASSLAPFERDETKQDRLSTKDKGRTIERYVEKATSAFYYSDTSAKPLSTIDTFLIAAKRHPQAALGWLKRLENLSVHSIETIFDKVPEDIMSPVSKKFAMRILTINRDRLLRCINQLLA